MEEILQSLEGTSVVICGDFNASCLKTIEERKGPDRLLIDLMGRHHLQLSDSYPKASTRVSDDFRAYASSIEYMLSSIPSIV